MFYGCGMWYWRDTGSVYRGVDIKKGDFKYGK